MYLQSVTFEIVLIFYRNISLQTVGRRLKFPPQPNCFALRSLLARTNIPTGWGGSHPNTKILVKTKARTSLALILTIKTPGDGFEPPLKEPESFVLPLDDPGTYPNSITNKYHSQRIKPYSIHTKKTPLEKGAFLYS